MITCDDILNLNYYKKTSYSGWMGGMRFLIKREVPTNQIGEETNEAGETVPIIEELPPIFHAWVWPGPFIFELTDDSKKTDATFPFSEDGRVMVTDWLNEQYETGISKWPKKKISMKEIPKE